MHVPVTGAQLRGVLPKGVRSGHRLVRRVGGERWHLATPKGGPYANGGAWCGAATVGLVVVETLPAEEVEDFLADGEPFCEKCFAALRRNRPGVRRYGVRT